MSAPRETLNTGVQSIRPLRSGEGATARAREACGEGEPTYTHHELEGAALRSYYDGLRNGRQMLLDELATLQRFTIRPSRDDDGVDFIVDPAGEWVRSHDIQEQLRKGDA